MFNLSSNNNRWIEIHNNKICAFFIPKDFDFSFLDLDPLKLFEVKSTALQFLTNETKIRLSPPISVNLELP